MAPSMPVFNLGCLFSLLFAAPALVLLTCEHYKMNPWDENYGQGLLDDGLSPDAMFDQPPVPQTDWAPGFARDGPSPGAGRPSRGGGGGGASGAFDNTVAPAPKRKGNINNGVVDPEAAPKRKRKSRAKPKRDAGEVLDETNAQLEIQIGDFQPTKERQVEFEKSWAKPSKTQRSQGAHTFISGYTLNLATDIGLHPLASLSHELSSIERFWDSSETAEFQITREYLSLVSSPSHLLRVRARCGVPQPRSLARASALARSHRHTLVFKFDKYRP